ncbi:MAG: DUF3024 domain-containing protein [Pseudomonadota bacterium]
MSLLPEHSRRDAERLLEAYCQRICPPEFREQVVLGWRESGVGFVLHEIRRICGVPGTARLVDVAQLRYESRRGLWRLYSAEETAGTVWWRRYPGTRAERNLAVLMRALDADTHGRLWPRVNGASLRWCSSRGRCAGCTERYRAALGAVPAASPAAGAVAGVIDLAPEHRTG